MPSDIDQQMETRAKEIAKDKQERDAAISKAIDETKLIDQQVLTAKAEAERQRVLSDLEERTALAKATQQKALIDLEKQIAEAQRDAFAARLPTATVTPLDGETTLGANTGYLAELVAYQAIRRAVQKAADGICQRLEETATKPRILIMPTLDLVSATTAYVLSLAQISQWQAVLHAQLTANRSLLKSAEPSDAHDGVEEPEEEVDLIAGVGPALLLGAIGPAVDVVSRSITAAGSLAAAAASVAALFRNDYNVVGRELSFKQEVVQSQMAHALSKFDMTIHGFKSAAASDLLVRFQECFSSRIDLTKTAAQLGARVDVKLTGGDVSEVEETKNALKGAVQTSNTILTGWDQVVMDLTTPAAGGTTPLAKALAAEQLRAPDITHYLYINVTSSGAESQTEKRLWLSGHITYQGGGILNYVLINRNGSIVAADAQVAMSTLTVNLGDKPAGLVDSLG